MKIFIDAGHGGDSVGATYKGRKEQDDCLRLALTVEKILLSQKNVEVKLSRRTDTNPLITSRCNDANSWGADYFISIHRNAFSPNKANGAEVYIYSGAATGGETYKKAKNILELVCAATGFASRGTKKGAPAYADYGVNRLTKMHSCLFEFGFIDNDTDNAIFDSKFDEMAKAVAKGLIAACGGQYQEKENVEPFVEQTLQIGSFVKEQNAKEYAEKARNKGLPVDVVFVNDSYKVVLDDVLTQAAADELIKKAKISGFDAVLVPLVPVVKGDIDGDGTISAADARLALRDSVSLEADLSRRQLKAADIDSDGAVNAADAREILRKSVGLEK